MDLLFQINEEANKVASETETVVENLGLVADYMEITGEELCEGVSKWLAKVRAATTAGKLDPYKKSPVVFILAALSALANPDLADAFSKEQEIGTLLYNLGSSDHEEIPDKFNRLIAMGKHPLCKNFVEHIKKSIDDPATMGAMTKDLQVKLEPVMKAYLAKERSCSASA